MDKVSILILSWNGRHHLEHCLPALAAQQDPSIPWDVLVLDNGSADGTTEWVRQHHPWVTLLDSRVNLGFCGGNNRLVDAADSDAVVLLNNDTRPAPDWLAHLVAALAEAPADVAAASGTLVDWEGERLDFSTGLLTFDGHAFQRGFGTPIADAALPTTGEEMLFACGGNMIIRRRAFLEVGGFENSYFAYLEDVDLGWRLWAAGQRVIAAPDAIAHHRSMATSHLLGNANRGFLFERNAFVTAYKNLDAELFAALMPAIWMTLVHRTQTLLVQNNLGGEQLTLDPYAGLIANTASPTAPDAEKGATTHAQGAFAEVVGPPKISLRDKWRGYGPRDFTKRALRKVTRTMLPSWLFDTPHSVPQIIDPRTVAQLQAITWILGNLDYIEASRQRTQAQRQRPDRDIFERFPPTIVATYPGDKRLFASSAFQRALPDDIEFEHLDLDQIHAG